MHQRGFLVYFFLYFFFILFILTPSTLAATAISEDYSTIAQNKSWPLPAMVIASTSVGDIQSEHGLRLMLDPYAFILWQETSLTLTGTAVDEGKIISPVTPKYSKDYKSLYIPVKKDFEVGDEVRINGLMVKSYNNGFDYKYIGVDLDGDLEVDITDKAGYNVSETPKNDIIKTYPVSQATYKTQQNGDITLAWTVPPDYDYKKTIVHRFWTNEEGFSESTEIYSGYSSPFTDADLKGFTDISYTFTAYDNEVNESPIVTLKIHSPSEIGEPAPTPEVTPAPTEVIENPVLNGEAMEKLKKLMDYYLLRYQIHCTPNGVAVREPSYDCYWPRIDLVYAQELTGEIMVKDLSLPSRDLELMTARRKFSEMRYENNCLKATIPAPYCASLKGALERISYFLD